MRSPEKVGLILFVVMAMGVQAASAGLINHQRRQRLLQRTGAASTPATTTTDSSRRYGRQAAPARPFWAQTVFRIEDRNQRRYDRNRDGLLQAEETKAYLNAVVRTIDARGRFRADTDILKRYDNNNDGQISQAEAAAIKKDLAG